MKILSTILPIRSISKFNLRINSQKVFNEKLKTIEKPIIANLKSYYSTAEEKLNDIYLDKLAKRQSVQTVKYNLDQFEKLPDAIKKALKPSDISKDGHISQSKINSLWDAAQKAHKPGIYGYTPSFSSRPEEGVLNSLHTNNTLDVDINNSLDSMPDLTEFSGDLTDGIDVISDAASDIGEQSLSLLDKIINFFS